MTSDPVAPPAESEAPAGPGQERRVRQVLRVRGTATDARVWPMVQDLAAELVLAGHGHDENGTLVLEVQGAPADVERFAERIADLLPPRPADPEVTAQPAPAEAGGGFVVAGAPLPGPPPLDLALCEDCRAELTDRGDRRYRHPFIACADCGPRACLVTGPATDREHSTMAGFAMCQACAKEDADPRDRRYRALGTCCPDCGPLLEYVEAGSNAKAKAPVRGAEAMGRARGMLRGGAIVAVKGPGGYHLACDATNVAAVRRLRTRRQQGDRPFTLLVADVGAARSIARLDDEEAALLASPRRPVVLLERRPADGAADYVRVVDEVAPNLDEWGVMLPPSALHMLLLGLPEDPPGPRVLVLTSAGRSDEPMLTDDDEAFERLLGVTDAWLRHDRELDLPLADSMVRVVDGRVVPIRWGRGYTPMPLALPVAVAPVLALGGDRDNAICLAEGHQAWLSGQTGTIDELSTQRAFERTVRHLGTLAGLVPNTLVADRNPAYRSAQWAVREVVRRVTDGGPRPALARVQQQHAHVAGVMADNDLDGSSPVIGFAFGGLGFADETSLWGGEVLIADYDRFHRFARLATIPLPGDEEIVLQRPYRTALAHLAAAGVPWDGRLLSVAATPVAERQLLAEELATVLTTQTSSLRLLVDAVASITGVCQVAQYDGQAGAELESVARAGIGQDHVAYTLPLLEGPAGEPRVWDPRPLVTNIAKDIAGGAPARIVAARFHRALANAIAEAARLARRETLIGTVALSGELFGNVVLQRLTTRALHADGFTVLWHRRVPPGDACLALGQLMIGARCS